MDLKNLFDSWGQAAGRDFARKQWFLSKWEVTEGIDWPKEKIDCMIRSISDGLKLRRNDTLVDLGCGGGWILKALKPCVRKIVGLDFSPAMLANAVAVCPEGEDKASFICGEIGKLPLRDETCERALSYFVFINFKDDDVVARSIQDIMRILKKGGRALIGQLPDKNRSVDYDQAKEEYLEYCRSTYPCGKNHQNTCRMPGKLFDKGYLINFLDRENIRWHFRDSFNPFYRPGQPETVEWRFDLILEKT